MSDVTRVQLGILPQLSVPDPILFIFRDSDQVARDLSGVDWEFFVVIQKGVAGTPENVTSELSPTSFDLASAATGQVSYLWGPNDLDAAESTKIQMIAQKVSGAVVTRRHISDIAVITVATSPASSPGFYA